MFLIASHNSGSEWLKLVAKSLTGEAVELKAKSSDTVATLKRRLQTKDDPSSWDQLLVLNKKQLNDEQTLADAGVTDGTILSVVLCPRESIFYSIDYSIQIVMMVWL